MIMAWFMLLGGRSSEEWSDSGYFLKVQLTDSADRWYLGCKRKWGLRVAARDSA